MEDKKSTNIIRYDSGLVEPVLTAEGFLRARVTLAKPGVFTYLRGDGKLYREAKLPDEIFSVETLESAKGKPVTLEHPPISDNNGLINSTNYAKYVKGVLGDSIGVEDGYVRGTEVLYDSGLIDALKRGEKREVSIGFELELDETPGELNGERYDAVQRRIRINHLAHTDAGRAGADVRVHLDSAPIGPAIQVGVMRLDSDSKNELKENPKMKKTDASNILAGLNKIKSLLTGTKKDTRKDEDELTQAQAAIEEVAAMVEQVDPPQDEKQATVDKELVAKLQATVQALQDLIAEKQKLLMEALSPAAMDSKIAERTALVDTAKSVVPEFKADGLTNQEIRLLVIEKVLPFGAGVRRDALKGYEIDARYDAAAQLAKEKANLRTDSGATDVRIDEAEIAKKRAARLQMIKD